jgi:hypothetical protein
MESRTANMRMLQEELQIAMRRNGEMKARYRELPDKLLLVGAGKIDSVHAKQKLHKGMLVCKLVGAEHRVVIVDSFRVIKNDQLHRVIGKGHLGGPETVILHKGKSDMKKRENLILFWEKYMLCWLRQRRYSELQRCVMASHVGT